MALNPRRWYPIAVLGSLVNVAAVAQAAFVAEPWHALTHAGLAVASAVCAQHLKARLRAAQPGPAGDADAGALRDEIGELRRELGEQERMDFAERVLSQARESDRLPGRLPNP